MNLDELTGVIERLRAEALPAKEELAQRIEGAPGKGASDRVQEV